jgi:UDP-glucose 4-epimerase
MNILITGGSGFLGSRLAQFLKKKKNNVVILDKRIDRGKKSLLNKIKILKADITSQKSLAKIRINKGYTVLHFAGQPSAAQSFKNPVDDLNKNIVGTVNLIEWCKKNKVKKIIYASTFNVYEENAKKPKLSENDNNQLKSLYAISKFTAENYIKLYCNYIGIKWNIMRMFNVYGPGQDPKNNFLGMISIFLNMARKKSVINVKGSLRRFRDFIYIEDVIDAWYKVINDKKNYNKVYNVGSGKKTSLEELFKKISITLQKKLNIKEEKGTPGDFLGCYADVSKIKKDLKFEPKFDLTRGLKEFNQWLDNEKKK